MTKRILFAFVITGLLFTYSISIENETSKISDGSSKLDIIHINVGQGDATLILGPKNQEGGKLYGVN